jgi:hypothetical protein
MKLRLQFVAKSQEDIGQFPQVTQEITDQITQVNQEKPDRSSPATPDNHG